MADTVRLISARTEAPAGTCTGSVAVRYPTELARTCRAPAGTFARTYSPRELVSVLRSMPTTLTNTPCSGSPPDALVTRPAIVPFCCADAGTAASRNSTHPTTNATSVALRESGFELRLEADIFHSVDGTNAMVVEELRTLFTT